MKLNATLHCKDSEIYTSACEVEKVIQLTDVQFLYFKMDLLHEYPFIKENAEFMFTDGDRVRHCLLVMGETERDGVLVDNEGYDYARYTALVPNAKDLLLMEQIAPEIRAELESTFDVKDYDRTINETEIKTEPEMA